MQINTLYLDRLPDYVPFTVQCTDATGLKTSPTVDNLAIYEENGADAAELVAADLVGNFDPVQLPTDAGKTGLWGVLIDKANFAADTFYICVWELTIDGVATAKVEQYFFMNSSEVKADVSALATEGNATANAVAVIAEVDENEVKIDALIASLGSVETMIMYLNGKTKFNIAAVAVPARLVEVGMLDTIDMSISATQVLHVELVYNSNKNVVDKDFTVV